MRVRERERERDREIKGGWERRGREDNDREVQKNTCAQ